MARTLLHDRRYRDFSNRYRDNLLRYVVENSRHQPTWQQRDLCKAIQNPGCRVGAASGHGSGKSFLLAWTIDWHLRVFPKSNAMLTATNAEQCRSAVWKYLDEVQEDMAARWPWQAPHVIKETRRYYVRGHKDSWYCLPKTASKSKPEGVAGQHNDNYIVLCDEASGIEDEIHGVLRGALTHERNRYVMMSQPTRITGHFAEAFTTLKDVYTCFNLNAEESPLVSRKFIQEKLIEYGGHHSPEYQIKVLGCFPDNLGGMLIPKSWCNEGQKTTITHEDAWGWLLLGDVAEGKHRDSSVWTLAKVSGYGLERRVDVVKSTEYQGCDEYAFADAGITLITGLQNVVVAIDAVGCGRTVILRMEERGVNVERIYWGSPPHTEADQRRYLNLRAYATVMAREALRTYRLRMPSGEKVVKQASHIPYAFDERGRYQIMGKEEMRSKGIKSPDIFDTICFAWLVDPIPCHEEGAGQPGNDSDDMVKWAELIMKGEV